MHEPELLQE
jgi:hypothetical protein